MRTLAVTAALVLCSATTFAQLTEKVTKKEKAPIQHRESKNEGGLLLQTDLGGNNNSNLAIFGLQYNRWVTPNVGYRIIAGYGNYQYSGNTNTFAPHPDTIITKQQVMNFNLPLVGFGLVAQRHFYRRVFLYAAVEVKGMYNKGDADTIVRTTYKQGSPTSSEEFTWVDDNKSASILMINMTASVGAKLQYSKWSFGAELLPVQLGYQGIRYDKRNNSVGDFSLGSFSQRMFLNYRF